MSDLRLRRATEEDVDLIYGWANDLDARKNSFHQEPIPYEDHLRWYERKMNSEDSVIFILMQDATPVGQCRLDFTGEEALISYFIDRDFRNRGYGSRLLRLVSETAKEQYPQLRVLKAQTLPGNVASQKVFQKLGYTEEIKEEYREYLLTLC